MTSTTLFVLDIPENRGVADVAARDATLIVDRIGPYFRISSDQAIRIDRAGTGCRNAVWYSCIAGLHQARLVQHDKVALRLEPL